LPDELHLVTTAVGVATAETLVDEVLVAAGLKWPNDIIGVTIPAAEERKLGGILAEAVWSGDRLDAVVVGLGLNVNWPHLVPVDLDGIATALNHLTGADVDREAVLVGILRRLDAILDDPRQADLIERWNAVGLTQHVDVRVELVSGKVVEGIAHGITDNGRLVVETDGGAYVEITAGDVHHLRPATGGG
jgi:BirA family biotin operon repressor/biotin-[acetyl-CoA-carboxylase] ligase